MKIKVSKEGYKTIWQDGNTSFATTAAVDLTAAGTTTLNVSILSLQTVTGTVTTSGGNPVVGAKIALFNAVTGAGISSTTTNSSGVYSLPNLTATSVKIKVTKDGYRISYQDGTSSLSAAAPVALTPAGPTTINITLTAITT